MKHCGIVFVLFFAVFLSAAELRIVDATNGDKAVSKLALKLAFEDRSIPVSYQRRSTTDAIADLNAGKADLVVIDVPAIPEEFKGMRTIYAVRALTFYVNAANPLEALKSDTLRKIFMSVENPNWNDYGILGSEMKRYGIKAEQPGADQMSDFLVRGAKLPEKLHLRDSVAEVVLMVGADISGIGYGVFLSGAPIQVRLLAVDGVEPTLKSVGDGTYPLAVKRAILSVEKPEEPVRKFLEEMGKADFRDLVTEAGMLPVEK